jgi:hypothetical protein
MATAPNPLELRQHFVAFLDVLGFKEMVQADLQDEGHTNLVKLFRCHQRAAVTFKDNVNCTITQFSDSIVVAVPYESAGFEWFAVKVGEYQRLLLDEGLLCRGGIAVNKHFSNGTFTFSAGLIQAYLVESVSARYPRVVVSPEVLELVYPDRKKRPQFLIEEDDGLLFVDYLGLTSKKRPKLLATSIASIVQGLAGSTNPSVREKGLWLATYSDSVLGTKLGRPRFVGKRVVAA